MQISREDCKLVTLTDIAAEARACSAYTITGHWTAGRYKQYFNDYHLLINDDGEILMPNGVTLDSVLAHTYGRNTGNIGVSMCCCLDAIITGTAASILAVCRQRSHRLTPWQKSLPLLPNARQKWPHSA